MVRLIYFVAKPFKNWPKTYRWNAVLTLRANQPAEIQSDWKRER
jgi:hypothetical protein